MKGIGFISLLLIFGILSVFGQTLPDASTKGSDVPDSESGKTTDEGPIHRKETRRIFKIINDYQLAEGEALTTLVIIAADARLQGR